MMARNSDSHVIPYEGDITSGVLVGFKRTLKKPPTTLFPVFSGVDEVGRTLLAYQRSNSDGVVTGFMVDPDLSPSSLIPADSSNPPTVRRGDKELRAYEVNDGQIVVGGQEEFKAELRECLSSGHFLDTPFAALEVSRFVSDSKAERKYALLCAQDLLSLSPAFAASWLNGTELSGTSRRAARSAIASSQTRHPVHYGRIKSDATREDRWAHLEGMFEKGERVSGLIFDKVKGGFTVDLNGTLAFLPTSQVDTRAVRDIGALMHQPLWFKIIKIDRRRSNIVVSRRSVLEETHAEQRADIVARFSEGQFIDGLVKHITDYGAFIDLGGIEGLLHVKDMAWARVNHPSKILDVGDKVKVQIIRINPKTHRISLGMKQNQDNPWELFLSTHPKGSEVEGLVRKVTEFGLFIGLDGGVDGLVRLSDLDWTKPGNEVIKDYKKGDNVRAVVLDVNSQKERISLGIKQLAADPIDWLSKYKKGHTVTCEVVNVQENGINVKTADAEVTAFIKLSDLSRNRSEQRPERFNVGDKVDALVVSADKAARRVSLSIKALEIAEEKQAVAQYSSSDSGASLGDIFKGAISKREASEE